MRSKHMAEDHIIMTIGPMANARPAQTQLYNSQIGQVSKKTRRTPTSRSQSNVEVIAAHRKSDMALLFRWPLITPGPIHSCRGQERHVI